MSAYFVETACIDRILTAFRMARAVVGLDEQPIDAECTAFGQALLRENARSIAYRYASIGEAECRDMRETANGYTYRADAHPLPRLADDGDALQVAAILFDGLSYYEAYSKFGAMIGNNDRAALAEYDYQACETDDYRETNAGKAVAAINAETLAAIALMTPAIKSATQKAEKNKREAAAVELKNEVARLVAENPHLEQGDRDVVEKNIRAELKLAFPGVKFSVRKDGYSATRISWTDGPTCAQVEAIARRHKAGHFDGMTDCYEYNRSPWGEAFGSVQYVTTSRDYSDDATVAAIQAVAKRYNVQAISLEEYKRNGWNVSPISGACGLEHMWSGLVGRELEGRI